MTTEGRGKKVKTKETRIHGHAKLSSPHARRQGRRILTAIYCWCQGSVRVLRGAFVSRGAGMPGQRPAALKRPHWHARARINARMEFQTHASSRGH